MYLYNMYCIYVLCIISGSAAAFILLLPVFFVAFVHVECQQTSFCCNGSLIFPYSGCENKFPFEGQRNYLWIEISTINMGSQDKS